MLARCKFCRNTSPIMVSSVNWFLLHARSMRRRHDKLDWWGTRHRCLRWEYHPLSSSRVFDTREALLEAAISLASTIASKGPIAVQGSKINLHYARDHTVDDNFTFVVGFLMQKETSSPLWWFIYLSSAHGIVPCYWRKISRKIFWRHRCRRKKRVNYEVDGFDQ